MNIHLKDWEIFYAYFKKFFGEAFSRKFSLLKQSFVSVTLSYLKAQFIIESIIFAELLAGFLFLRINYAVVLALAAAIVDAVPILGTGTVLIPMSVFYFLSGNQAAGWGLLIIYGVALLTRQLCEPKIIGAHLHITNEGHQIGQIHIPHCLGDGYLHLGGCAAQSEKSLFWHFQNFK